MKKLIVLIVFIALNGCSVRNQDAFTGEDQFTSTAKGCFLGLVGGAGAGAGIGAAVGDPGIGAAIGAVSGLVTGCGAGYYMDSQEEKLRIALHRTGVRVQRYENQIKLVMPANVLFDTDSANINSRLYDALNSVILVLNEFDDNQLRVFGFTDSRGSFEHNQILSENRANSVAQYLVVNGVNPARLKTRGMSERFPVADNKTVLGRKQNRRVELVIE